jgi:uroporphyrin-III C-methyltransferase
MRQVLDWQGQMAGEPVRDMDPLARGHPAEVA